MKKSASSQNRLSLSDIPACQLEAECLRRAIKRTTENLRLAQAAVVNLSAKLDRQKRELLNASNGKGMP